MSARELAEAVRAWRAALVAWDLHLGLNPGTRHASAARDRLVEAERRLSAALDAYDSAPPDDLAALRSRCARYEAALGRLIEAESKHAACPLCGRYATGWADTEGNSEHYPKVHHPECPVATAKAALDEVKP